MKGVVYPRPNKSNDLTYYYDSEKSGVIHTTDGDYTYKGVVTAVKVVDSRDCFYAILNALEAHKETKLLAMAWSNIAYRAETANPRVFKATAYCAPEDTFDLKTGMRLARHKVQDKFANSCDKYLYKIRCELCSADKIFSNMYI